MGSTINSGGEGFKIVEDSNDGVARSINLLGYILKLIVGINGN